MTILQQQRQLHYLGFLSPETQIDGILGPKTQTATTELQQAFGIKADGIFGPHTEALSRSVIENIQRQLAPYAAGELALDGLAGPDTAAATEVYQFIHDLSVTARADDETRQHIQNHAKPAPSPKPHNFWAEITYFRREELRCKCGGKYCNGFPAEPKEELVRLAEQARRHFGRPAHVVSCLRCPRWNALSGGVANSQHMYGEAMDLRIDGVSAEALYRFLRSQPQVRYTYKINDTNVHFDIPKGVR